MNGHEVPGMGKRLKRSEEEQRIAKATEYGVGKLLGLIASESTGHESAMLAGAIAALVKFTFAKCWHPSVAPLSTNLLGRWQPMMLDAVSKYHKAAPDADA